MPALEANIPCPHCHKTFSVLLTEIGPGKTKPCPNCGSVVRFAGQDATNVQHAIDQLKTQLGGSNVKINVNVRTKTKRPWWKFW